MRLFAQIIWYYVILFELAVDDRIRTFCEIKLIKNTFHTYWKSLFDMQLISVHAGRIYQYIIPLPILQDSTCIYK